MPLSIGDKLGPYEILATIGKGGMGEVYRAHDSRMGRDVAIKVSAERFNERFDREVRAVAALNHSNICHVYDVGPNYLVMELVEGPTLAEKFKEGAIPLEEALNIAKQIADALEAAHEKGTVHRDVKPGNIKIRSDAVVKMLDFGLATVVPRPSEAEAPSILSTESMALTEAGTVLGTAAYMSPEQASGKPVDRRADIWAFGVVFFEMLTGHRLFEGETVSHTLAGVLAGSIDFDQLPRETPAAIRGLLRRCLDRNVKNRLRDIGEARIAIEAALTGEPPLEGAPVPGGARRLWLAWSVAVVAIVAFATVAFLHVRATPPAPAAPLRFQIPAPENADLSTLFNVSPDGRKMAFLAGGGLWVHFFESGESRNLTDANGTPFWSPDSRFIGYAVASAADAKLKRIEATGGVPQTVADYRGAWGGGAWNQDGMIVFSTRLTAPSGFFRVPAAGGVPVQITAVDPAHQEEIHYSPSFLPDGQHFVYTRRFRDESKSAVYLGSLDLTPEQQSTKPLVNSFWGPRYTPSADPGVGYLLFVREETLMAQTFDNARLELTGHAAPIAEQINDGRAFGASDNVLVFQRQPSDQQLIWYDREGKALGLVGDPGSYGFPVLSPDGTRAAFRKSRAGQSSNIWLQDLSRGTSTPFAFGSSSNSNPVWSPDGTRIIFSSNRDGSFNLYQGPASGVNNAEVLLKSSEDKFAESWSSDGRFLLYSVRHPKTKADIWVLPLEGDKKPTPFLVTEFNEQTARFSPDSHWVAYVSDESGRSEVYVRSISMNPTAQAVDSGSKWLISNGGGGSPMWRSDGRELYYNGPNGVMAVDISTTPALRAATPRPLGIPTFQSWTSTADGKRFLLAVGNASKPEPYTVVLNWQAGLKK
jgi:Tol biopolymer transport system component/predicted Ser/Thr protein kinase